MQCGFWNLNDFNCNKDSEKYYLLSTCTKHLNLDILCVAETHLTGNNVIDIDVFSWFGQNRENIHIRAKKGSGGVGILVRKELLNDFKVEITNSDVEGILWIKFTSKVDKEDSFYVCSIYLPPEFSSRAVNVNEFYDSLLSQIYTLPGGRMFYLCGDISSRVGENLDYIPSVDDLPNRNIVDFNCNSYGEIFIDFLINCNLCILNDRNNVNNDITFISTRGKSVFDYCLCDYEQLKFFDNFSILKSSSLISEVGTLDLINIVPDNSVLKWTVYLNFVCKQYIDIGDNHIETEQKLFLTQHSYLMMASDNITCNLDHLLDKINASEKTQTDIDTLYRNCVTVIKDEMENKLPKKTVRLKGGGG